MQISLKAARVNADLTQEQTAELIGKTKQTIVNWENGVTEITAREMDIINDKRAKEKGKTR